MSNMDSSSKEYPQGHIQVMENDVDTQPQMPNGHRTDALATKFVDRTGDLQGKAQQTKAKPSNSNKDEKQEKQPAGGHDETPVPSASPGYTLKFTFHRATNLPMADINSLSSDPFIVAQLHTSLPVRHKEDPPMRLRTPTIRRSTEPVWNCEWIVANVPASGFALKARLYDEDPADHDDRLGNVHVHVNGITGNWEGIHEQGFKIKKRMGSTRAYLIQGCAAMFSRGTHMAGELFVSVKLLERTESNNEGRTWTVGPCAWSKHLSPLIGRLAGTKEPGKKNKDGEKETERYKYGMNALYGKIAADIPKFSSQSIPTRRSCPTRAIPSLCRIQTLRRRHVHRSQPPWPHPQPHPPPPVLQSLQLRPQHRLRFLPLPFERNVP